VIEWERKPFDGGVVYDAPEGYVIGWYPSRHFEGDCSAWGAVSCLGADEKYLGQFESSEQAMAALQQEVAQ
jgi:hypothetical protein